MKQNWHLSQVGLAALVLHVSLATLHAKGLPVGDISLTGVVQRAGQQLRSDATIFEGDAIRTGTNGGGVVRIGRGRLEINESSEVEIATVAPLKVIVREGSVGFSFPAGTPFEVVTPQLRVTPNPGSETLSGTVLAEPGKEDRVLSRSGRYTIRELELNGSANEISGGQVLIAALAVPALPQGPIAGPQIAILSLVGPNADIRVNRAATPNNVVRVTTGGLPLGSNDRVRSLNGTARITFSRDQSFITLVSGTDVTVAEVPEPTGIFRRIAQAAGRMYFDIQRAIGTRTQLSTPTAVAAIRGTVGEQEVIGIGSIHSLNEGIEDITENITGSRVTITNGQTVTAIRGVGFSAIGALAAAVVPSIGGQGVAAQGGAPGGGGGAGAGGGAGGGGAGTGAAASTATASTVSTVASAAVAAAAGATTAAIIPAVVHNETPASSSAPLSRPGVPQ